MDAAYNAHPERLLPLSEVMRRTGKGRSSIYAAIRAHPPSFPLPVKISATTRWVESEVSEWIASHIAARDAKVAA